MRPPRHRFSDRVRSITRSIAGAMVKEGGVARTPQELEDWISRRPDLRRQLEEDGYDEAFSASDLFPLLTAMAGQPVEPVVPASTTPRVPRPALVAGGALIVAVVIGVVIGLLV